MMTNSNIKIGDWLSADRLRTRECRQSLTQFLDGYGFHLFITLATNRTGKEDFARDKFKGFMARFDSHNAGRNWQKKSELRSVAVASIEHMDTNLHLHIVLQIPELVMARHQIKKGIYKKKWEALANYWRPTIEEIWNGISPQGNADTLPYWKGASSYFMKGAGNRVSYESLMISTEFWPSSDSVKDLRRDANSQRQRNDEVRARLSRRGSTGKRR